MSFYDYTVKIIRNNTGKSLSFLRPDGSLLGIVRIDFAHRVAKNKKQNVPIRLRDNSDQWQTVGWLNRTKNNDLILNDANGNLICFFPVDRLLALIGLRIKEFVVYKSLRGRCGNCG